jgi:hypothetical protein
MLGIARMLVKDVVHLWKRNFFFKNSLFLKAAQTANNHFWISRNFKG